MNNELSTTGSFRSSREWLEAQRAIYARRRDKWAARETRWSWSRLLLFVAVIVGWVAAGSTPLVALGITLVCVAAFAGAVRQHHVARDEREFGDRLLLMVEESGRRCGGAVVCLRDWQRPADDPTCDGALPSLLQSGATWALTDQERDDLDAYASPVGVFGLLNRASTALGARRLRDWLDHPCLGPERIQARQAAAQWLEKNSAVRQSVMAAAATLRKEDARLARLVAAFRGASPLVLSLSPQVVRIWSCFSVLATLVIALLALGVSTSIGSLFVPLLLVNGGIYCSMRARLADALQPWRDVAWAARGLSLTARTAARELPAETDLATLRARFAAVADDSVLRKLSRRVGWSESGGLAHELFNVIGFFDLHVADSILKIALKHRDDLLASVAALGELEAFASLACFAWEQPVRCWPTPVNDTRLQIEDGVHPLVSAEHVVANDVSLSATTRMWIITGSNMAGKSTFLRMVGVNVLLAQVGSAATAKAMHWTPARLISDLRARDSLAASESYFLSEVRHLRRMVLPPPGEEPILGLIDEPFRGTNSQDQTAASVAVVRHLLGSPHLFLLATHDRHLTTLADGKPALNWHFRENLGNAGLVFDYRLHDGPATTRNALRILEREGYPAALVEQAHAWQRHDDAEHPPAGT